MIDQVHHFLGGTLKWLEPVVLVTFIITFFTTLYDIWKLRERAIVTVKELRAAKWREWWLTVYIIVELLINISDR
jgi:hypothetical protein